MTRVFRHISDNAVQFGVNQVLGLGIFYVLSKGLDKSAFGELNWSLALALSVFNLIGAGLDQLTIKKVAEGQEAVIAFSLYKIHVWVVGIGTYVFLWVSAFCFPHWFLNHHLILWIFLAKTFLFLSLPYKQWAAGTEQFNILLRMSIPSSIVKMLGCMLCYFGDLWSAPMVVGVFIAGDMVEWMICIWLGRRSHAMSPTGVGSATVSIQTGLASPHSPVNGFAWKAWLLMLRESLPQAGVALCSTALARFDWIFIGLYASSLRLAEYSFAYKAFEVSCLPLMVIGPVLIPLFTRLNQGQEAQLPWALKAELILACATALALQIGWTPIMDPLTSGKYGSVNQGTISVLSICIPILYLNNFLWTLHFVQGRLTLIFWAFALSIAINITGNILLMPIYGNMGAAMAYVGALFIQTVVYTQRLSGAFLKVAWMTLAACLSSSMLAGYAATRWVTTPGWQFMAAGLIYVLALIITAQLRFQDLVKARNLVIRSPVSNE
jgi:O-antigen/teichoic acid export membrane protein